MEWYEIKRYGQYAGDILASFELLLVSIIIVIVVVVVIVVVIIIVVVVVVVVVIIIVIVYNRMMVEWKCHLNLPRIQLNDIT